LLYDEHTYQYEYWAILNLIHTYKLITNNNNSSVGGAQGE